MAGFTLQTHKLRKDKRSGNTVLTATDPYARISGYEGQYFVQHGLVWSEGGQLIDPVPAWVMEEIEKLSPKVKKEIQWDRSNFEQTQEERAAAKKSGAAPGDADLDVDRSRAGVPTPRISPDSTDRAAPTEEDLAADAELLEAEARDAEEQEAEDERNK